MAYELSERQRGVERAKSFAIVGRLRDAAVIADVILVRISGARRPRRVDRCESPNRPGAYWNPRPDVVEITRKIRPAFPSVGAPEQVTRADVEREGIAGVNNQIRVIAQIRGVDCVPAAVRPCCAGVGADAQPRVEVGPHEPAEVRIDNARIGGGLTVTLKSRRLVKSYCAAVNRFAQELPESVER